MRYVNVFLPLVLLVFSPFSMGGEDSSAAGEMARSEAAAKAWSQLNAALGNSGDFEPVYPKIDPNMECMIGPASIPLRSLFRQLSQLDNGEEQAHLYFRSSSDGKTPPPVILDKEWLAVDLPERSDQQVFLKREEGGHYLVGKTIYFMTMNDKVVCVEHSARFGPFGLGITEIQHKVETASTGECAVGAPLQNTSYGAVLKTFCENLGELERIYQRMSQRKLMQQGEITLWLSISEYGEVTNSRLIQSTMHNSGFEFRVLRAASEFDFGRLEAGGWEGEHTLRFAQ